MYPSLNNTTFTLNQASVAKYIGVWRGSSSYFDGLMSQVVVQDGQTFSSITDYYDSGPVDVSGLTLGDDGGIYNFTNSGDLGEDSGAGSNDFTNSGVTQSSDTP